MTKVSVLYWLVGINNKFFFHISFIFSFFFFNVLLFDLFLKKILVSSSCCIIFSRLSNRRGRRRTRCPWKRRKRWLQETQKLLNRNRRKYESLFQFHPSFLVYSVAIAHGSVPSLSTMSLRLPRCFFFHFCLLWMHVLTGWISGFSPLLLASLLLGDFKRISKLQTLVLFPHHAVLVCLWMM